MEVSQLIGASFALTLLLAIIALALVVFALLDLFRQPMDPAIRLLWILVILFFPLLGSVVYLIASHTTRGRAV